MSRLPRILLFGRANVGKSSLFNRLVGRDRTIVHSTPGTTRDLVTATIICGGYRYTLVDAAGYEPLWEDEPARRARDMLDTAINEAELILFIIDATEGAVALDYELAERLRHSPTPVLVVANKAESLTGSMQAYEASRLGIGDPLLISALHKQGLRELREAIADCIQGPVATEDSPEAEQKKNEELAIAIVGRPNVGKSSLVNVLVGEERLIISETPGTTRDAVDVRFAYNGRPILLVDTAGMRKRAKVRGEGLERETVKRALDAAARAHVVCLVLDADKGAESQDASIAEYTLKEGKPLVIIINKWDLLPEKKDTRSFIEMITDRLKFVPYALHVFVSAKTKQRIGDIFPICIKAQENWQRRITTAELNRFMESKRTYTHHGHEVRIKYLTQIKIQPPTFAIWVNDKEHFHFSHIRNLENRLREAYNFTGTPIRMLVRASERKFNRSKGPRKERDCD